MILENLTEVGEWVFPGAEIARYTPDIHSKQLVVCSACHRTPVFIRQKRGSGCVFGKKRAGFGKDPEAALEDASIAG